MAPMILASVKMHTVQSCGTVIQYVSGVVIDVVGIRDVFSPNNQGKNQTPHNH